MTTIGYLLNLVATAYFFFSRIPGYSSITGIVFAALYLCIVPLIAFFGWHKSLYNGLKYTHALYTRVAELCFVA